MSDTIELRTTASTLTLAPSTGASIDHFVVRDTPILVPGGAAQPGCFPLAPFFSRIRDGRFEFDGRAVRLPPNVAGERDVIHGHAFQRAWSVVSRSDASAMAAYRYDDADWPWRYEVTQSVDLSEAGVNLEMRVNNLSATDMPVGLGWHPFFPAAGAEIVFRARCRLELDSGGMPIGEVALPDADEVAIQVTEAAVDHVFLDRSGDVEIRWTRSRRRVVLHPSNLLRHLVVYKPAGAPFVCVEPVSNIPDGFNRADEYPVDRVPAGQSVGVGLNLSVS